jgi:hypothetical protein
MIITKLVLSSIKDELDTLGYPAFLYIAPQNTAYPFVTFMPIATPVGYSLGPSNIITEEVSVQISVFVDSALSTAVADLMDMSEAIEIALDEKSYVSGTTRVNCVHRTNETGPNFMEKEEYWQINMDFNFMAQRDKV